MKILLILLSLAMFGCGDKNETKGQVVAPQSQQHIIKMQASALQLYSSVAMPNSLRQIHRELFLNGQISQAKVLRAQVDVEAAAYETRTGQNINEGGVYGNLMKLAAMVPSQIRLDGLKNAYMSVLKTKNNKEMELNFGNGTLVDPVVEGRMNSLSGSKLFDFIMRAKNLNKGKNMVMIFRNGHVTPGFMVRPNQNQANQPGGNLYTPKWNLIGIETTGKGLGFLHFGDPNSFNGQMQIIDADEFLLVELFKNYLRNPMRSVRGALRRTCRKYSISCTNFPSMNRNYFATNLNRTSGFASYSYTSSLNSVFAFGSFVQFHSSGWVSFSHQVVTGARYVNNRYVVRRALP